MQLTLGCHELAYPVRVLSDLHFRDSHTPLRHRHQLRALFAGAGTVILNGDTLEEVGRSPAQVRADLDEVEEAAREVGSNLVVLSGNHDPTIFRLRVLHLPGHSLTIHHGDGERAESACGATSSPRGRRLSWSLMRAVWKLWGGFHRRHLRGLRGNMVVGHSHRPGVWRTSGGALFNLGCHGPLTWARALEIDSPEATHWRWRKIVYRAGRPHFAADSLVAAGPIS